jgi:putative OPT family oligopeptide transporter
VIFTMPALVILGYWNAFDYVWVSVIAGLGGLLGVLFTIPLRRALIVDEQLAFPEGAATAEVLKVGAAPGQGAKILALAGMFGAVTKLVETGLRLWAGTAQAATYVGSSTIAYVGMNLSPALVSVGYIVGLNIAILIFIGGAISWYVAIPIYSTWLLDTDPVLAAQFAGGAAAGDLAFAIWTSKIRYLGVGAMLVGGIWALISMRGSLVSGIISGLRAERRSAGAAVYDHTQHDTPMRLVLVGVALFIIPIFVVYQAILANVGIALAMTLVMVVAGFLFTSVAGYMAGIVGSSNNPISGITIATILFSSLLLFWLTGGDASSGPAAAVMVGAVVCCAAAIGGDNLQDLKAGYIVGATPWKQQLMQAVGVVSAVLVMAPILNLLLSAYGIGVPTAEHPDALLAPQATLMASVAEGVFGAGLPWGMVAAGAGIGIAIIVLDERLKARKATWRAPVLAVAVGIYLPLELSTAIALGGVVAHLARRRNNANNLDATTALRNGMLFASGLITGEALIGIIMAVPIAFTGNPNVFALDTNLPSILGLFVVAALAGQLYRVATRSA